MRLVAITLAILFLCSATDSAQAQYQRPGHQYTPTPAPMATATATVTPIQRSQPTPTPLPVATQSGASCWTSSGFNELSTYWNNRQSGMVCIPVRTPSCLPGLNNNKCHKYVDYEVGAGCGAVEGRIACEKRPLFADPRNYRGAVVTPNQAGLVDTD